MTIKRLNEFGGVKKAAIPLMNEAEYFHHVDGLQTHLDAMLIEGKDYDSINEDFSGILGFFGGGFKQTLYQYAAEWLLTRLGLTTKDANGKPYWIVKLAIQIVTKIDFTRITDYFGEGSCKNWLKAVEDGLIGFLDQDLIGILAESLGMKPEEARNGILNTAISTVSNSLTEVIRSSKIVTDLEKQLNGKICGEGAAKFSDIFKNKSLSPEIKKDAAQSYHEATKEDPSNIGDLKGLGLDQLLFGATK